MELVGEFEKKLEKRSGKKKVTFGGYISNQSVLPTVAMYYPIGVKS